MGSTACIKIDFQKASYNINREICSVSYVLHGVLSYVVKLDKGVFIESYFLSPG